MTLQPGARLGPYEILAPLGAGGMGEVYKAKDTRLDRAVAVKVLASHLSQDAEVKQRFEREARAISSLSHPHICALHDVGSEGGVEYLVMELLEGETLAERLTKGALPPAQVLRFGVEIAEALGAAHRRGIVHRDLKPGNVMLTKSGVKLLDFGLAKENAGGVTDIAETQTKSIGSLTGKGTILGTLQYMAPEQLEGKEADSRTDIFALGSVLYEMATGKKAFSGSSHASLISAILKDEPTPISQIQPMTPPAVDHAVKKCLSKDPDERWQSAQDVGSELKWIAEGSSKWETGSPASRNRRELFVWRIASVLLTALGIVLYLASGRAPIPTPSVHFSIPAPKGTSFYSAMTKGGTFAVSPDGGNLAFVSRDTEGQSRIWIRPMTSLAVRAVPGTENARFPFWSPDSRWIAFFADGKLKKKDLTGDSPPETVCDAADARGGSWGSQNLILFSPNASDGIFRVSAEGGTATRLTSLSSEKGETTHRWPQFLPDGRHFLYFAYSGKPENRGTYVGSLDSKETTLLIAAPQTAIYTPQGYLIYSRGDVLVARSFDAGRLRLGAETAPIGENVAGLAEFIGVLPVSVSENGLLSYWSQGVQGKDVSWFDRAGKPLGTAARSQVIQNFRMSSDASRVAISVGDLVTDTENICLLELSRGTLSKFTFNPSHNLDPVWSPDGTRIAFASDRDYGGYQLYEKPSDGSADEKLLLRSEGWARPQDWSPDGRFILYQVLDRKGNVDLLLLPMSGDRKPVPFLQTEFREYGGSFSPDGKWIAYVSEESGRAEVYVRPFSPAMQGKWQVSTGGGYQPRWRRDGRELFYLAPDGKLMAVPVSADSAFRADVPRLLFQTRVADPGAFDVNDYDAAPDGQRFLIAAPGEDVASLPITVVLNWTSLLKK